MDDHSSQRFVPFSWENKPGVSKVEARSSDDDSRVGRGRGRGLVDALKLPPPPCPLSSDKHSLNEIIHQGEPLNARLPPCVFDQRPVKSSSKRGFRIEDDPFLMAYKECTKTSQTRRREKPSKHKQSSAVKTVLEYFSCKTSSCSVIDGGSTVRILPPQPRFWPSDTEDLHMDRDPAQPS